MKDDIENKATRVGDYFNTRLSLRNFSTRLSLKKERLFIKKK